MQVDNKYLALRVEIHILNEKKLHVIKNAQVDINVSYVVINIKIHLAC